MNAPRRRILIPAIRDMIVKTCPISPAYTEETIDKWTAGETTDDPVEKAVFAVCDQVATELDAQADDLEDAGAIADRLDDDLEDGGDS
jgi:hypothetical protein